MKRNNDPEFVFLLLAVKGWALNKMAIEIIQILRQMTSETNSVPYWILSGCWYKCKIICILIEVHVGSLEVVVAYGIVTGSYLQLAKKKRGRKEKRN